MILDSFVCPLYLSGANPKDIEMRGFSVRRLSWSSLLVLPCSSSG